MKQSQSAVAGFGDKYFLQIVHHYEHVCAADMQHSYGQLSLIVGCLADFQGVDCLQLLVYSRHVVGADAILFHNVKYLRVCWVEHVQVH